LITSTTPPRSPMLLSAMLLLLSQPAMLLQTCGARPIRLLQHVASPATPIAARPLAPSRGTVRMEADAETEASGSAEPEAAAEAVPEPPLDPATVEKQELKDQIADLERQLKAARGGLIEAQESLKDAGEAGYMLLAADFERFRLRAKDELGLQANIGKLNTVRQLLPFIEEFEGLMLRPAESEETAAINQYYGGIYKQLSQQLEAWQVSAYEATVGEAYSAAIHSKSSTVESEQPADTIVEQVKCGWKMGDEVLRAASCVVSSGPAPPPEEAAEEAATEEGAGATDAPEEA